MASTDIFNRRQADTGGVITSDSIRGVLSSGTNSWVGVLIQSFTATYTQQNRPLYELGSNRVYRVVGRPEGQMQIGRIRGYSDNLAVEEALFDVCNTSGTLVIQANSGTCNGESGGFKLVFGGLSVVSYSLQTDANSLLVMENLSLTFNYLARVK